MGVTSAIVLAGAGAVQQNKARKEQKKAAAAEARIAGLERKREALRQIRAARAARAQVINVAAQTGTAGSSAESGAVSSVQTQLGSNIGFLNQTGVLANRASAARQNAADYFGRADLFNTAATFATNFSSPNFYGTKKTT